jgi:hypothetical protein
MNAVWGFILKPHSQNTTIGFGAETLFEWPVVYGQSPQMSIVKSYKENEIVNA